MQVGHLKARGRFVEAGILARFGFCESLIDESENVGAVALLLELAAGNLGLDESGNALRQITDFVGFL